MAVTVVPMTVARIAGGSPFSEGPMQLFVWDSTQVKVKEYLNDHSEQFLTFSVMKDGGAMGGSTPAVINRDYIIHISKEVTLEVLREKLGMGEEMPEPPSVPRHAIPKLN